MAVSTLLERLHYSKQQHTVSLFVSASIVAVGFDKEGKTQVASCSVSSNPWLAARELLDELAFRKMTLNVVLGHGLFQSILIDDPGLSEQDKCLALPFHIRDLISGPPTEIVADGYSLQIADRYQVFATQKGPLLQFTNDLKKRRCKINCVSVESVVLSQWTDLDKTEMVLSKDGQGVVQLSVFNQGKLCFLRQIRGMTLDEAMLQPRIVDELVLEIQRSLDYLQQQLKAVKITGLVVSLQGVEDNELALQLLLRLSIPVRAQTIFEQADHFQHITLAALKEDFSPYLNLLLCGESLTQKPFLTFGRMITFWGMSILLMGLAVAYQQVNLSKMQKELALSLNELELVKETSLGLDEKLSLHLPSLSLSNEVESLKELAASKRAALEAVMQHDGALQQGYVSTFDALTTLSRKDISIAEIFVSLGTLNLKGLAATPEAVPSWLQSFHSNPKLAARVFESMELTRNEKDTLLHFRLNSKRDEKEKTL